jgi:predicted nucleic acid-binding protein
VRAAAVRLVQQAEAAEGGMVITSDLSRLECRVRPLREGNQMLLERFDAFFSRPSLALVDVSPQVLDRATELRAAHGFKTPDAIHLATALLQSAGIFLTGDDKLKKCPGLEVVVLDPSPAPR